MAKKAKDIRTVAFVSLGCPKNLVDSERMLGLLAEDGLALTADAAQADAIVINTCGFLEASKTESMKEIRDAVKMKEEGQCKRVVVAGCLVQRHKTKLLADEPGIDRLVGVFDREHIVEAIPGIHFRSFSSSVSISRRVTRRRIFVKISSLMCCSGMSMYFTTRPQSAIVLIISSLKQDGYAYINRNHRTSGNCLSSVFKSPDNPAPYPISVPYDVVSCPIRFSSTAPSAASSFASSRICSIGFDRINPRIEGIVQNVHPWLHPSDIRR